MGPPIPRGQFWYRSLLAAIPPGSRGQRWGLLKISFHSVFYPSSWSWVSLSQVLSSEPYQSCLGGFPNSIVYPCLWKKCNIPESVVHPTVAAIVSKVKGAPTRTCRLSLNLEIWPNKASLTDALSNYLMTDHIKRFESAGSTGNRIWGSRHGKHEGEARLWLSFKSWSQWWWWWWR